MQPQGAPSPTSRRSGSENPSGIRTLRMWSSRNPPTSRSRRPATSSALKCAAYRSALTAGCQQTQQRRLVDKNTICMVGVAGTTEYGMVDPIADLAKIACQHDLFLHVDAAFGGMVIPFLDKPIPFDFALPGVTTIAVDPHKMGMSTIPAGCLLTREPDMLDALNIDTPYLTVKKEVHARRHPSGSPGGGSPCGTRLSRC